MQPLTDKRTNKLTLRRGGFTFKQFFVAHDRCGMKVTTDGVILGSWVDVKAIQNVLDIGTGTGLLTLMLAQRAKQHVRFDAVEIDEMAARQAQENSSASPWSLRITVHHADILDFAIQTYKRYDLIICNPPYFPPGSHCRDDARATARYRQRFEYHELLQCVDDLLAPEGRFALMLPCNSGILFEKFALSLGWFTRRKTWVCDVAGKPPYIVLLELSKTACLCEEHHLITHLSKGREYTEQFKRLVCDFYLAL